MGCGSKAQAKTGSRKGPDKEEAKVIFANEGNYSSINADDNGALSVGNAAAQKAGKVKLDHIHGAALADRVMGKYI